jgi:hypothetical protein
VPKRGRLADAAHAHSCCAIRSYPPERATKPSCASVGGAFR